MSDPDHWPTDYSAPPKDKMHALGIIALNYNSFEYVLFAIFRANLLGKLNNEFLEFVFGEFNRQQQVEAIRVAFKTTEIDPNVIDRVTHLLKFFHWCYETRDLLMHSHHDQYMSTSETLKLMKRSSGDYSKFLFMELSLHHLRAIADNMYAGYLYALNLFAFLEARAAGMPAGFASVFPAALPSKPPIPRPIKLKDGPEAREGE